MKIKVGVGGGQWVGGGAHMVLTVNKFSDLLI